MFYSHEILTSREAGIATVWLVATLGSKSNNKRVNRKSILEVDVKKTCDIIIQPEAPMALRLQGNLLYGVARVYSRQFEYVLSDAEIIQANIRALLKAVKASELDPNAGKARPDQLVVQDDPAFLPDLAIPGLDIDLSAIDITTDKSSRRSSLLSLCSQHSSLSSNHDSNQSMLGLVIPSSATGGGGELGGFQLHSGNVSSARRSVGPGYPLDDDEEFNIEPGFIFDSEGHLIEDPLRLDAADQYGVPKAGIHSATNARVRQGLMEGLHSGRVDADYMDLDLELPNFNDDQLLPDAEAFPEMVHESTARPGRIESSSATAGAHDSSSSAGALLRRKKRIPRQLPVDQRQELRNTDLAEWKENYAANMAAAKSAQVQRKATTIAKKNAAYWVLEFGIGGVGVGVGTSKIKSPLDEFSGPAFLETLRGTTAMVGQKRTRHDDGENDTDDEGRNVRLRDDAGEQFGRGDDNILQDDDTGMFPAGEGTEVGRHAQPPLEDPSMPWNISASSRQGSFAYGRGFQSSIGGFSTSAGGPQGSLGGPHPSSLDRRASRVTSASPLHGRGQRRYSGLELPVDDDESVPPDKDRGIFDPQALEDFELYGPGAGVATQTAADSQWVRNAMTQEATNFLAFVINEIEVRQPPIHEDEDELSIEVKNSVLLEELLPPLQHSKAVGAQGFYHVLVLATGAKLNVQQLNEDELEGFGPIRLEVLAGA